MYGWPQGMLRGMSETDSGMPPSTIPPMNPPVNQPAAPPMNQPVNQPTAPPMNPPMNQPAGSGMLPLGMFPLGMAYVPMQRWSQPSPLEVGFRRGTMFKELDLPFLMGRCQ